MVHLTETSTSSRVKACSYCRQQKLRCDAQNDYSKACSRCLRLGFTCTVYRSSNKIKRRSKAELQEELNRLKRQAQQNEQATVDATTDITTALISPAGSLLSNCNLALETSQQVLGLEEFNQSEIEDCFTLFIQNYAPKVSVIDTAMDSTTYFALSPLLFWTMTTIGSRKYASNPTLLGLMYPRLADMIQRAAFAPDLATIQALLLLCTWPSPVNTLSKEVSTVRSASMLQLSMNNGLHVRGVGQDFSRTTLIPERGVEVARAQLWIACLTTTQRVNCSHGLPPLIILDTYNQHCLPPAFEEKLSGGLLFERRVSSLLTEGIITLSKISRDRSPTASKELLSMVRVFISHLAQIPQSGRGPYGHYHLLCAQLQVQSFQIFVGQELSDSSMLVKLHNDACALIETVVELDNRTQFSQCATDYTSKMLHLAASIVLRLARSWLKNVLNLARGQEAYFSTILLFRRMSIQHDDVMARSTVILAQLWTSSSIFTQPDGTVDSFSLLCRSRLAMSSVFDVWWRWRNEFAQQPHPYPSPELGPGETVGPYNEPADDVVNQQKASQGPERQVLTEGPGLLYDWDACFDIPPELFGLGNDESVIIAESEP